MIRHPVAQREPGRKTPQPKSRFSFSLRTLFILTALVAAVSTWAGTQIHEAHEQADAIIALGLPASEVEFEPKDNWQGTIRPILPKRVAHWLGEPFFSAVVGLEFKPSSDAELCLCLHFPDLESVSMFGFIVSAEGLRQLQSLPRLRVLDVGMDPLSSAHQDARITDRGGRRWQHVPQFACRDAPSAVSVPGAQFA
jgi:hypothetical protein